MLYTDIFPKLLCIKQNVFENIAKLKYFQGKVNDYLLQNICTGHTV